MVETVYVKTRAAVLRETSEPGSGTIMELYVPAALKVLGTTRSAYQVEIVGWVEDVDVTLQDDTVIATPHVGAGAPVWPTILTEFERLYLRAIGNLTGGLAARFLGERVPGGQKRIFNDDGTFDDVPLTFLRVRVTGWIDQSMATANVDETQTPGTITGTVTRAGEPAAGIEIRLTGLNSGFGVTSQTDAQGRYEFGNLMPADEYKLNVTKPETGERYTNLLNFPILDPGERLDYGNVDLAELD